MMVLLANPTLAVLKKLVAVAVRACAKVSKVARCATVHDANR